ncbi:methylated-DNA--[protein]-cysteine S-methyltransferase [Flavobacterium sp.]|uniref:methylated-DNA--[protein]-cysteine S-methyltransferase n=1 Tax=Flavobacterium sp. TaxID=239 RepID=UPI003528832F
MKEVYITTPLGTAKIVGNKNGITEISVGHKKPVSIEIPKELQQAVNQLTAYFKGNLNQFELKLNPEGTEFQQKVWQELQQIPYGKTISYLELSKKLDNIKAIRAVAAANGKNPLWIVVPCHRVIGSNGSLTGYAGGLWRKQWLLEHEKGEKQQTLF